MEQTTSPQRCQHKLMLPNHRRHYDDVYVAARGVVTRGDDTLRLAEAVELADRDAVEFDRIADANDAPCAVCTPEAA